MTDHAAATGPLEDVLVVDLSRALAGPHATMMLGDLGARVIKVEAPGQRRRHPRLGPAVRRRARRDRQSTYFLSANRNKESIALDLKDEADTRRAARGWSTAPTCWSRTSAPACSSGSASASSRCSAQPAPRGALDHRLRPRRAGGRPRRLRPDRPGRGRPDVADRLRARRPAAGRRTRSRTCCPACTAPTACVAALHERRPHRRRHGRAYLAAGRGRRGARLPGHPLDRGRRGRPRAGQPPPVDRAVRAVPLPRRRGADRGRQRGPVAQVLRGFGLDPAAEGLATNRERVGNRERVIEVVEEAFADWDAEPLLARLAEVGIPAGKVRTLDEVYEWDQAPARACWSTSSTRRSGGMHAARPAAALLRRRRRRARRPAATTRAPADARPARRSRSAPGWRTRRVTRPPSDRRALDAPPSCSTWCSTRARSSRGTRPIDITGASTPATAPSCARPRRSPAPTSRCSPGAAWSAADRSRSWSTSSASSRARSAGPRRDRIIAAVRRATAEGLPLLATTASGGTRMQEGTPAFVQMVEISRALMDHRAAGLPYLVVPAAPHHRRRLRLVGVARRT